MMGIAASAVVAETTTASLWSTRCDRGVSIGCDRGKQHISEDSGGVIGYDEGDRVTPPRAGRGAVTNETLEKLRSPSSSPSGFFETHRPSYAQPTRVRELNSIAAHLEHTCHPRDRGGIWPPSRPVPRH